MNLLAPAGLFSLLLAIPIFLLYMLRLRRQDVIVPSTYLWQALVADRHANRPWQKLRHNWLLYLQLLILLALALSLARPAIPTPRTAHGQIIILLDASASMQAQVEGMHRFDIALRELRTLAATLETADTVALITVGPIPQLWLQSGDATALRRVLDDLDDFPRDGGADWRSAAALAAGLASGDATTTLLVTDAALADELPALPGTVRLISVGQENLPNVGIAAFALRRTPTGLSAFVRLRNAGSATTRTVTLYADDLLVARQSVVLEAEANAPLTFDNLPATAWAEVRLEQSDALALDNRAWVALADGGSGQIWLVTPGNRFLSQALSALPGIALTESATWLPTTPTTPTAPAYDLLVADHAITDTLPTTNLWLIAPDGNTPCGTAGNVITPTRNARGQWTHPLLQYVIWDDVHIARARHYIPPDDADILLESTNGPLLWILERPGQRVACLAFELHDSDLPLRLAFPILTANLVGWLLPQTSTEPLLAHPAGQAWTPILPPAATAATVIAPNGNRIRLDLDDPRVTHSQAGLYRIESHTAAGTRIHYAALSLQAEAEIDLRPRDIHIAGQTLPPTSEQALGWRDITRWIVAVALILLIIEAIIWWQLGRIKSRKSKVASLIFTIRHSPFTIRTILVVLLLLALLGFRWTRRTRDLAVVFLLDRSASTRAAWEMQRDFVAAALSHKAPRDQAALIVFGSDAWVDRALSPLEELSAIATLPRADATDIAEAVRLGLALIPDGAPGRMVLLTDGLETAGPLSSTGAQAAHALREARARNVDLHIVQTGDGTPGPEVWLADLQLPTRVYPGDRVPVIAAIGSNTPQNVNLYWTAAGQSGHTTLALTNASHTLAVAFTATESGFLPLRVCLEAEQDTFLQNNCAAGWVLVEGAPRVLLVGAPEERAALARALRQAGLTVDEALPNELPLSTPGLADYASIVLANTPARAYAPQTLRALQSFVRDLGGGLVAVGGPQSYGVGGWLGTPLEETLPVEMRVQDPSRFPPLAMVVVIDKSGSMGANEAGVPKIRLAAEAAIRVAETLNDTDTLAVVAYDDRPADTLGPVTMNERDSLIAQLRRLQAGGGGIYVRESMVYAAQLLAQAELTADTQRHILLLSDGSDAEHQEGVIAQVSTLAANNTTVSVVAIGQGPDVAFLRQVADTGLGRFYLTQHAADLPAIFAEEAAQAKRSYIVEQPFYPVPVSSWPPVTNLAATPPLGGYVATTPKNTAQVVWEATQNDPLLAVWQYGLGRAVAWTSDGSQRWAAGWTSWSDYSRFWGALVRHILPPPSDGGLVLRIIPEGEQARILLDASTEENGYADGLALALHIAQPGTIDAPQSIDLHQSAPGRYVGRFTPPAQQNALLLRLHGDRTLTTGWAEPASEEYLPGDAEAAIKRLAAQGNATLITKPEETFAHTLKGRETGRSLAPILLLLAVLLWPIDIAWRRLALTRADIMRVWQRVRAWIHTLQRQAPPPQTAVPMTLATHLKAASTTLSTSVAQSSVETEDSRFFLENRESETVIPKTNDTKTIADTAERNLESNLAARLRRKMQE